MQATLDPVDNVFVALELKMTKLIYGSLGFVAGALIVFVLSLKFYRRKQPGVLNF
jgi:hypothetical protein